MQCAHQIGSAAWHFSSQTHCVTGIPLEPQIMLEIYYEIFMLVPLSYIAVGVALERSESFCHLMQSLDLRLLLPGHHMLTLSA